MPHMEVTLSQLQPHWLGTVYHMAIVSRHHWLPTDHTWWQLFQHDCRPTSVTVPWPYLLTSPYEHSCILLLLLLSQYLLSFLFIILIKTASFIRSWQQYLCEVVDVFCFVVWTTESIGHWSCRADCIFSAFFCSQGRCFWIKSGLFKCSA